MIRHYLKIACRNLLKYKTQSIISILGLAIGFTCFALAVLWIRYEMTYDTFHEGFDRIHLVYQKSALSDTGVTTTIPYPVSTSLEKQFPEVEDACGFLFYEQEVTVDDGAIRQLYEINADSCFMHMFGIQVLSGSLDFLRRNSVVGLNFGINMLLPNSAGNQLVILAAEIQNKYFILHCVHRPFH